MNNIPRASKGKPQDEKCLKVKVIEGITVGQNISFWEIQRVYTQKLIFSVQIKEALMVLFSFPKHRNRYPRNQTLKSFPNKSNSLFPSLVHTQHLHRVTRANSLPNLPS